MIREIPHEGKRVETGAVQFGDDWPGLFVRGDDACHLAAMIHCLQWSCPELEQKDPQLWRRLHRIKDKIDADVNLANGK